MAALPEDLLDPDAFPAIGPRSIELIETHISWVFLTEEDAFKVKKPVELGFLDFRTLEQRRVACEAEVRLNARLAPHVYKGVVPVRRGPDGRLRIGFAGEIVDWAVHMVRLPDAWRAVDRLRKGELTGESVDGVSARLAAFHAAARCDEETSRYGAPEAVAKSVEENFRQMGSEVLRHVDQAAANEIEAFQRGFLRERSELLAARVASRRVRDGHGDLRLEHVYLDDRGGITIIDCIEFNDRFRYGDVCADVAFLAMDLAYEGRVDLAERLVARYARDADDFDLYPVLDFYESYRAVVRAKVSMMLAADESAGAEVRARADAAARRFLVLASAAPRRPLIPPMVVAVAGVIASGKSTVADAMGAAMGAPVVDADRTRKHLAGVAHATSIHDKAWSGAYELAFTHVVYAEVRRRADVVLASGRPVVIDASFRSAAERRAVEQLARDHAVPFLLVECRASKETCRARLRVREAAPGVSDGRLAVFEDFCASFEPVVELPAGEHVVVDTERALAENLLRLRPRIAAWPEGLVC